MQHTGIMPEAKCRFGNKRFYFCSGFRNVNYYVGFFPFLRKAVGIVITDGVSVNACFQVFPGFEKRIGAGCFKIQVENTFCIAGNGSCFFAFMVHNIEDFVSVRLAYMILLFIFFFGGCATTIRNVLLNCKCNRKILAFTNLVADNKQNDAQPFQFHVSKISCF